MTQRSATLDPSRVYRYTLERTWDPGRERVLWIMLNPSTADETSDDRTIQRCMDFARGWNYGGIIVGNLFALISPKPETLLDHPDPVGPDNNKHLQRLSEDSGLVVAAWGVWGSTFPERQAYVKSLFRGRMSCLGVNRDGTPKHPVRLGTHVRRQPYGS